jgi:hypothetical protein
VIDLRDYRVTISTAPPPRDGASPSTTFSIEDKRTSEQSVLTITNYTKSVERVFAPVAGELVALGEIEQGGKSVNIFDVHGSRLVDTFRAWRVGVSHNLGYAAYQFRYPPWGLPQFRNAVLLLYDFRLPPSAIPHVQDDAAQTGFILYPDENRVQGKYQLASPPAPAGSCCSAGYNERMFTSPIAWSESDTQIGVLEAYQGEMHVVVVDIGKGVLRPGVTRWKVDSKLFLKELFREKLPDEYEHTTLISASRLEFVDDDKAIEFTSTEGGPFAARTALVSLADGSQSVLPASTPPEKHLELPAGTEFIRVGGAVQEKRLITKTEPVLPPGRTQTGPAASVQLEALIGKNGRVEKALAVKGPPELFDAAEAAVRGWLYQATFLNGQPVAVLTTVEVSFPPARPR